MFQFVFLQLFAAYEGNDKNAVLFVSKGAEVNYIGWVMLYYNDIYCLV